MEDINKYGLLSDEDMSSFDIKSEEMVEAPEEILLAAGPEGAALLAGQPEMLAFPQLAL